MEIQLTLLEYTDGHFFGRQYFNKFISNWDLKPVFYFKYTKKYFTPKYLHFNLQHLFLSTKGSLITLKDLSIKITHD
jgi:hypothetical protein